MPKVKTRKIANKRYKVTGTGKLLHRTQGSRHLRRKKDKRRQRSQDMLKEVTTTKFAVKLHRMLQK
jgi:large subunit ribosomal protein L35